MSAIGNPRKADIQYAHIDSLAIRQLITKQTPTTPHEPFRLVGPLKGRQAKRVRVFGQTIYFRRVCLTESITKCMKPSRLSLGGPLRGRKAKRVRISFRADNISGVCDTPKVSHSVLALLPGLGCFGRNIAYAPIYTSLTLQILPCSLSPHP